MAVLAFQGDKAASIAAEYSYSPIITFKLHSESIETGSEQKYRAFVGYYLEFDHFYEHADNVRLLEYLYWADL